MADQKNPEFEAEEVEDKDLEDVSGGEDGCVCCETCAPSGDSIV